MASQRVKLKDQILDGVARSVKEVQAYSFNSDSELVRINNEARPLQRLVDHLDHVFLHGLKHVSPGYWVFVKCFTHRLLISDIIALDRLATDLGRSRAWLYQSLNERALESYLRCFLDNESILRKFYVEHSLLRDSERLTLLITLVSGLDHVTFDLELNVAYFDLVSYIPRSASDPRELDDTISIHSNLSVESGLANEEDSGSILRLHVESGVTVESSARDNHSLQCATQTEDESVTVNTVEEEETDSPATFAEPNAKDADELQKLPEPVTSQVVNQTNNNDSGEVQHPRRSSSQDFDINMENVGEQNQNLEVIRISKKSRKKRTSSKVSKVQGKPQGVLHERSSSPSTVSVTSSCIEELDLEEKEDGLDFDAEEHPCSSPKECSAAEDDMEARTGVVGSLPECEATCMPSGLCSGVVCNTELWVQNELEDKCRITECASIISEMLDKLCNSEMEQKEEYCMFSFVTQPDPATGDEKIDSFEPGLGESKKPWLPSTVDRVLMQDSFNSSLDITDHSMVYWQGEVTDGSFDADVSSVSQDKTWNSGSYKGQQDREVMSENHSTRTEELSSREYKRLHREKGVSHIIGVPKSETPFDDREPIMLSEDINSNSGKLATECNSTRDLSRDICQDDTPSVVHNVPFDQDSTQDVNNFVQVSRGIPTGRSGSLSSGMGTRQDATDNDSNWPSRMGETDDGSCDVASQRQQKESWKLCTGVSLVQSVDEEDQDSFVVVDVVKDGPAEEERHRGDGMEATPDPLHAMDVFDSTESQQGHSTGTDEFDHAEQVTIHEAEMKVDHNLKLYLMLEIFKIEDEKFHKLLRMSTGHMEGNLTPVFILLTDIAIYILRRGEHNGHFSTESRLLYKELDYVLIGLNYQSIQLVCRNRRRQHWLTTGSETLTRFFLHSVKDCMSRYDQGSLCVLTDATAQAIGLKKYVSREEKTEMSGAHVCLYSLVHWEDLLDSSTAADLQLYLPATKVKGMLHYKTRESFFLGSYWKAAYFKLKNNVLKRYSRREDGVPDLVIDFGSHEFGGCRRVHHHKFSFELVFTDGTPPLQLSCQNELQLTHWLQSICEAVSQPHSLSQKRGIQTNPCQPSCAVITSESLFLCLEDVQTHFFRTLARTNLGSIAFVEKSARQYSYLALNFQNSECDNPWLLYFNCVKEQDKFISELSTAYQIKTTMKLKICRMRDDKLRQRCSNCQELILLAWQRSDSLKQGRVRGDVWQL